MRIDKSGVERLRVLAWLCALLVVCVPMLLQGEVLYLKDGSAVKGTAKKLEGDTLTFETALGGRMLVPRSSIAKIVFSDSIQTLPGTPLWGQTSPSPEALRVGKGLLSVVFKDREVSSKVTVRHKKNETEIARANWILQVLIVDGDTVSSILDSNTNKTIYKGLEKIYKNNAELEDVTVELDPGLHHCVINVRNLGADNEDIGFDDGPLDMSLGLENIQIFPARTTIVRVGINKGKLRLGKARFYRAD